MERFFVIGGICLFVCLQMFGSQPAFADVDDARMSDRSNTSEWLAYGRTHYEQRFSPLADIHVGNVDQLGVDWFVELPEATGLAATPLVAV